MQGSLDDPPIVIVQARWKTVLNLAVCVLLLAGAAWDVRTNGMQLWAYAGFALFGLGLVVFPIQLARPGSLVLTKNGIAWTNLFRTTRWEWWQVRNFRTFRVMFQRRLMFDVSRTRGAAAWPGSFGGGWELSLADLCGVLTAAQARWGTPAPD